MLKGLFRVYVYVNSEDLYLYPVWSGPIDACQYSFSVSNNAVLQ